MIKKLLTVLALLGLVATAEAATPVPTVTWSLVTTNTDGTAVSGAVTYQLYVGVSGQEVKFKTPVTSPPYIITPTPAPGTQTCVQVTATANGVESAKSAEVCTTQPAATPNAPANVKIVTQ